MRKKINSIIIVIGMCMTLFMSYDTSVKAQEKEKTTGTEENIDYSYFTENNALYGYANVPRGVYLLSGDSVISKINSYTIGVAGKTNAALKCDVSVTTIVERYNLETDRWGFITSWTASKENAFSAAISKSLVIDSGYYYRVRSLHYAGTDSSSSYTNALYVGN
jgi:hypothetical protein